MTSTLALIENYFYQFKCNFAKFSAKNKPIFKNKKSELSLCGHNLVSMICAGEFMRIQVTLPP